jgi:predicted enzyme related to lactoylglutathione lyase
VEVAAAARGSICIVELNTPDLEHAGGYYADIFGWTTIEALAVSDYGFFQNQGKTVGAIRRIPDGVSFWLPYVLVEDVEQMASRAVDLGASIRDEAVEVTGVARTVSIQDPAGGVIGFWEPCGLDGAEVSRAPGSFSKAELFTADIQRARNFYWNLLGWSAQDVRIGNRAAVVFRQGDRPAAGMTALDDSHGPRWQTIFAATDCRMAVDRAEELGGTIERAVRDTAGVIRLAAMIDPGGAFFSIVEPLEESA